MEVSMISFYSRDLILWSKLRMVAHQRDGVHSTIDLDVLATENQRCMRKTATSQFSRFAYGYLLTIGPLIASSLFSLILYVPLPAITVHYPTFKLLQRKLCESKLS